MSLVAGIDVGGTKTLGVAVDGVGRVVADLLAPTTAGSGPRLVASTAGAVRDLASRAGSGFAAVGIGVPGVVDPATGTVRHAVNLGLDGEAVSLAAVAEVPVVVENDVDAAALGAAGLGYGDDLAYLSIGTGVAAGFVLGGRLRRGAGGVAGEIGHLVVEPGGPACSCGQRGCLEAVASGAAIARRWPGGAAALLAAATGGDGSAVAMRDEVAGHLAAAVTLLALTVDPAVVVLGGGAGPGLAGAVAAALRRRASGSALLAELDLAGRLVVLPPDRPAGALGAARLAREAAGASAA